MTGKDDTNDLFIENSISYIITINVRGNVPFFDTHPSGAHCNH